MRSITCLLLVFCAVTSAQITEEARQFLKVDGGGSEKMLLGTHGGPAPAPVPNPVPNPHHPATSNTIAWMDPTPDLEAQYIENVQALVVSRCPCVIERCALGEAPLDQSRTCQEPQPNECGQLFCDYPEWWMRSVMCGITDQVVPELIQKLAEVLAQIFSVCKKTDNPDQNCLSTACYAGEVRPLCDKPSDGSCAEFIHKIDAGCNATSPEIPDDTNFTAMCVGASYGIPMIKDMPELGLLYIPCVADMVERYANHYGLKNNLKYINEVCRFTCPTLNFPQF